MSIAKIAILIGASIVTVGGSAAVATRDKWLPKATDSESSESETGQQLSSPDDNNQRCDSSGGESPSCPEKN